MIYSQNTPIDFWTYVFNFLSVAEAPIPIAYLDGRGIPTIGVGEALVFQDRNGSWSALPV